MNREVQFEQKHSVRINPFKGYVAYGHASRYEGTGVLDMASVGYLRFLWSSVEKEEGVYDWSAVDDFISSYSAIGKRAALGCLFASSTDHATEYFAPPYIYDKCRWKRLRFYDNIHRSENMMRSVYHDDPVFLGYLGRFLDAFAERYDGREDIEFIDVRSLGNWGEGHSILFLDLKKRFDTVEKHILMHLDRFKKTKVVICWGEEQYEDIYVKLITSRSCGIRRDGILGNSDGMQTLPAMGHGPGVFEFWGPYDMMKRYGWWDGRRTDRFDDGGDLCYFFPQECRSWWTKANSVSVGRCGGITLERSILNGRPTHIGLGHGKDASLLIAEQKPFLDMYSELMGYDLFLEAALYEDRPGPELQVTALFANKGLSMLYESAYPAFFLTDGNNRTAAYAVSEKDMKSLFPSQYTQVCASIGTGGLEKGRYTLKAGFTAPGHGALKGCAPVSMIVPANDADENGAVTIGEVLLA